MSVEDADMKLLDPSFYVGEARSPLSLLSSGNRLMIDKTKGDTVHTMQRLLCLGRTPTVVVVIPFLYDGLVIGAILRG